MFIKYRLTQTGLAFIITAVVVLYGISWAEPPAQKGEISLMGDPVFHAPLRSGNNNLFHSLILIPSLESAERLESGRIYLQSGVDYAAGNFRKEKGQWLVNYSAKRVEPFIDLSYGVSRGMELKASLTGGMLAEDKGDLLLFKSNRGYISGERGMGLSDLVMSGKFLLTESLGLEEDLPSTSALGIWLKKPLADKEDFLSSGGRDLAIAYLETDQLDEETFVHTQIGYTFTGREEVFREDLKITNPFFYGVGICWQCVKELMLIGQIQGNLNAFREIKALNQNPLSVTGGLRYSANGRFFTEAGMGWGLNDASSDFAATFSLGKVF